MLRRKAYEKLLEWKKNSPGTAAFIKGARQIGKTTLARAFGEHEFSQLIEINFIEQPEMTGLFRNRNAGEILTAITAATQKEIIPGDTLVLLDEIQECPDARTAIKFLVEDGRARFIETGSLLGVNWKEIRSFPVGFETQIPMFPMDFEEFCWANRVPEGILGILKDCYEKAEPADDVVHQTMLKLFYTYMIVGGMPAAVQSYVDLQDLAVVRTIQTNILELYRQDIARYAKGPDKNKIREIFDSIPSQLDAKNNRFVLAKVDRNARMQRYENSFLWLSEAGVALPCMNVSAPVTPLSLNEKRSLFKLYMNDTGLLCAASLGPVQLALLNGETDINSGSLMENAFAQAIASKNMNLNYYDQKRLGELDFVLQNGKSVDIFEIKSGNDWKHHPALDRALGVGDWRFGEAIVFCKGNTEIQGQIRYLPFYMIMFYEPQKPEAPAVWKLDLGPLQEFLDAQGG